MGSAGRPRRRGRGRAEEDPQVMAGWRRVHAQAEEGGRGRFALGGARRHATSEVRDQPQKTREGGPARAAQGLAGELEDGARLGE